jgi:D-alanine-D-alanine ligase
MNKTTTIPAKGTELPVIGADGALRYYEFSHLPAILDVLRKKLRLAVIYAGDKSKPGAVKYPAHNVRDWKSYEDVARDIQTTLREEGFEHVFLMPDDRTLFENLEKQEIEFAWLNTGGVQGYDPTAHAPAMLEMMGVPYIGHDPLNVSLLDNKDLFRRELVALGFKSIPFFVWNKFKYLDQSYWLEEIPPVFGDYRGPFVVKPVTGRASKNVMVADTLVELPRLVDEVYENTRNKVLIEKYLPGREYCVAIYGAVQVAGQQMSLHDAPFCFSHVERVLESGERIFTSMDQKALTAGRFRLVDSASDTKVLRKLEELAIKVFTYFNLSTLIRLDVRADADGEIYVLEANPKPDLKKPDGQIISIVSMGLPSIGMTYNDLIVSILANRLHQLFGVQRGYIRHVIDLLR